MWISKNFNTCFLVSKARNNLKTWFWFWVFAETLKICIISREKKIIYLRLGEPKSFAANKKKAYNINKYQQHQFLISNIYFLFWSDIWSKVRRSTSLKDHAFRIKNKKKIQKNLGKFLSTFALFRMFPHEI